MNYGDLSTKNTVIAVQFDILKQSCYIGRTMKLIEAVRKHRFWNSNPEQSQEPKAQACQNQPGADQAQLKQSLRKESL
jgi:hypothetical protein